MKENFLICETDDKVWGRMGPIKGRHKLPSRANMFTIRQMVPLQITLMDATINVSHEVEMFSSSLHCRNNPIGMRTKSFGVWIIWERGPHKKLWSSWEQIRFQISLILACRLAPGWDCPRWSEIQMSHHCISSIPPPPSKISSIPPTLQNVKSALQKVQQRWVHHGFPFLHCILPTLLATLDPLPKHFVFSRQEWICICDL